MSDNDNDLRQRLGQQPLPRPSQDLAARIVQRATALPQRQPWQRRLQLALEQWRYGWSVKLASLAVCAVLGSMAGHTTAPPADADVQLAAQVMGTLLWADEQ